MFNKKQNTHRGFTLIELLVVIAIIALLATMAVASLKNAQAKSRDARRIADLRQLRTALELYYDKNNSTYPTTASYGEGTDATGCTGGWDCSFTNQDGAADGDFMEFLSTSGVMTKIPDDPLGATDATHHFRYYYYGGTAVTYGCQEPYYVLVAYGLETTGYTDDTNCYTTWANDPAVYRIVGYGK